MSGLDVPRMKQSDGFAISIAALRPARVAELTTMPGEENAAPAVSVLARVGFLASTCSDVVAKPEKFCRQSVDARLSASKLLQRNESGPAPELDRGEERPRAAVQMVEASCLSF